MSYARVYSKSELRPFDVMVAWQLVNGKGQGEAIAIAATISSRGRSKQSSSLTKKEKKERDKMWQDVDGLQHSISGSKPCLVTRDAIVSVAPAAFGLCERRSLTSGRPRSRSGAGAG